MNIMKRQSQVKPYDPFQDFFATDKFLDIVPDAFRTSNASIFPAIDVHEDKENITLTADLPGLKQEEIQISLENSVLTIQGERTLQNEKKDKNLLRVERSYGSFRRSIDLGISVDSTKVKASYKNGVLEIVLPKQEQAKTREIKINVE